MKTTGVTGCSCKTENAGDFRISGVVFSVSRSGIQKKIGQSFWPLPENRHQPRIWVSVTDHVHHHEGSRDPRLQNQEIDGYRNVLIFWNR
jgi:hypothetical protein